MNREGSNKNTTDFPKHNWGWMLTILSVIADTHTLIQWQQGNQALSTVALLMICTSGLWLSLFYIYFKTKKVGELHAATGSEPRPVKKPLYPEWARRLALAGIIAVPVFSFTGFAIWKYIKSRPSDKIIILVADFEGPDPKNYRVTETIIEQLREATQEYSDVWVKTLNETITAQQGSEVARTKGKKEKASIVLWGWYGKTEEKALISIHFELLQKQHYLSLQREKETLNVAAAELENFEIQTRLSRELSYLTLLVIGLVRYEAKDYDSAITRFTNALNEEMVPEQMVNPANIYFYRGTAYLYNSNFDQAITDFSKTLELQTDYALAYHNRSIAYFSKGEYDRVITDIDQAIRLKSDDAYAYSIRGTAYYFKGQYDSSIANLNQVIKLKLDNVYDYYYRGLAYYYKGDRDNALLDFDQAIKLKSDYVEAYISRGNIFAEKGIYFHAIQDYSQAIKLKPDDTLAYYNRGLAYFGKGDWDYAIADFDYIIKLKPHKTIAFHSRGLAYIRKGGYNQAIADLSQAIKLKFDYGDAYCNRGNAYLIKGDYNRAIMDFNLCIKLKPNDVDAYYNRGNAYKYKGDFGRAITDFDQAIKIKSDDVLVYYNRGDTYKLKNDKKKAIIDFKKILELTNDPDLRKQAKQQLQALGVNFSQK